MIKELKKLIYSGAYEDAAKICHTMDINQLSNEISWMGFDEVSIASFGFVEYMIVKTEETKWIELMGYMGMEPFDSFNGLYYSLYCARELLRRERSVKNLEKVAFFESFKSVKSKELKELIAEIIAKDPSLEKEYRFRLKCIEESMIKSPKDWKIDEDTMENALHSADFPLLETFFEGKTSSQIQREIYDRCLLYRDINSFAFCDYMFRKTKDASWMQTGIKIFRGPLSWCNGAETVAFGLEKNLLGNYIQE